MTTAHFFKENDELLAPLIFYFESTWIGRLIQEGLFFPFHCETVTIALRQAFQGTATPLKADTKGFRRCFLATTS